MSQYSYHAVIVEAVDGDSLLMYVDLGFYIWTLVPVRLTGMELRAQSEDPLVMKRERQALEYLQKLAANDETVILETTRNEESGVWLADIIRDGKSVNEDLERLGLLRGSARGLSIVH